MNFLIGIPHESIMHGHIVMPKVQNEIQKLLFGIQVWWSLRLNARLTYTFQVACSHRYDKECQLMKSTMLKFVEVLKKCGVASAL